MCQQWLRIYMRSQMIKHNKDLLESVDDADGPSPSSHRLDGLGSGFFGARCHLTVGDHVLGSRPELVA